MLDKHKQLAWWPHMAATTSWLFCTATQVVAWPPQRLILATEQQSWAMCPTHQTLHCALREQCARTTSLSRAYSLF